MDVDVDTIAKIEIDAHGHLLIYPSFNEYPMIYREAAEVHWEPNGRYLYSPKPREWSYLDWFKHIISIASNLTLWEHTQWENIPDELRISAEQWIIKQGK